MDFQEIWDIAAERKGGHEALAEMMPDVPDDASLRLRTDAEFLSGMAKAMFRAGFKWYIVKAKWPGFEEAFFGFDPATVAAFDVLMVDELAQDTRIVRNRKKIEATINNAQWMLNKAEEHGSFADWIADWPVEDIAGLWAAMQKEAVHLGPATGPYYLREMGKDSWLLTRTNAAALVEHGIFETEPKGKRATLKVQDVFNTWHQDTELPYSHLSRILAYSTDA